MYGSDFKLSFFADITRSAGVHIQDILQKIKMTGGFVYGKQAKLKALADKRGKLVSLYRAMS